MDIQTFLHNLHEEVCCSVCMCKYTDPKQLPCLHSFCLHCLNGIQRTSASQDKIACPECRQEFKVPESGNLSTLPTNFRINSLLDVLVIKECNTTGVKCGNCDKQSKQSFYCFQCCVFWCDDCISFHNGIKANKAHYALALNDFQDQDFENILKRPAFCGMTGHEKKELEFFCKICEVGICNTCALTEHEGHAKMLLELAANERKLRVKSAIEFQKQRVETKISKIVNLEENVIKVREQAASVKRKVQEYADSIIAAVEAKKLGIFEDVEKNTEVSLEHLGVQKDQFEEQVKMHETAIKKAETLFRRSTSAQLMQPNALLDKIFKEEGDQEDTGDCDTGSFPEFDFVKNQQLFDLVSIQQIGSLKHFLTQTRSQKSSAEGKGIREAIVGLKAHFVVTTRNIELQQCHEEHDCVTLEIRNSEANNCVTEVQVQDNKDGTYKISYFAKETGSCRASVKVNGEHVYGSPYAVQVKPRQFIPVLSFGQQGPITETLAYPWGVAVNGQNEIAVSDIGKHKIYVFSSNGTHIKSFGEKGNEHGELNRPSGIAFHDDNIIVSEQLNHRVQVVSRQGGYLKQFGGEGGLDHQFNYPLGLSLDSDDNIIVSDSRNKLIKIFSSDGQFLRKIGTEGSFTKPCHCIEHDNYLIVSDMDDHSVKCFDREGNFLYKFGKKGNADGEFNEPFCLSINKAGHLMVCEKENHRVQVFEISGKFIAKFGTKGSEIGQFNTPISTAVLTDGKIVVSDYYNHRIQIYE